MAESLKSVLAEFDPDPQALLSELCTRVKDPHLRVISECDYGEGADENYAALRQIQTTLVVPYPLEWEPKEVCELTRWGKPEIFEPSQVSTAAAEDRSHHLMRAFACAVLLRFGFDDHEGYSMGENQTAAAVIGSALVLGRPLISLTCRCLAALGSKESEDRSEQPFMGLGVLVCALAERGAMANGQRLRRLAESLIAEESLVRAQGHAASDEWLLGLTFYGIRHDLWRSLARHYLTAPAIPHPPEADEVLRLVGGMIMR